MENQNNNQGANGQRISVRPGNFNPPHSNAKGGPPQGAEGHRQPQKKNFDRRPKNPSAEKENGQAPRANDKPNPQNGAVSGQTPGQKARNIPQNGQSEKQRAQQKNRGQAQNLQKNRGQQNHPQNRPQGGQNGQKPRNAAPGGNAQAEAKNAGAKVREQKNAAQTPNKKSRREEAKRDPRRGGNEPKLSATLQKELDDEFNTPALSSFAAPDGKHRTSNIVVEDTREFEVDIATAAYLVEDVPCGLPAPGEHAVEVVGVRFRQAGKMYFFAPNGHKFSIGDRAIVDTARGPELGDIVMLNRRIAEKEIVQPLRQVIRAASKEDLQRYAANRAQEAEALRICAEKIAAHKLDMRLVDAQYAFDNSKLLFYFTSEGRVDFRDLVRDLAAVFHTRIELRQIGIRDESRLIGGLGMCGRPFCCSTFLSDFGQVSVKMAKEQGLSINTSKISGCCGRLMCCLRYEHETYMAEAQLTPKKDTVVQTPEGVGTVVESTPISGMLKVRLNDAPEGEELRVFHRDDVTPVSVRKAEEKAAEQAPKDEDGEEAGTL